MKVENTAFIDNKCVKGENNNLTLGYKEKLRIWKAQ